MRRHRFAHLVVAFGVAASGALGVPGAARADVRTSMDPVDPAPAALVARMSEAVRTLHYEGDFVHVSRGSLSSMRILHSTDAHGELERLTALDGEAREVVRDHERVTCIWPASASVIVTEATSRRALPAVDAPLEGNPNYTLHLGPLDRVAGREARTVDIDPVDALRYGYRFWIDSATDMLLRSMLLDEADRVLEEVLFTRIEFRDAIPAERFVLDAGARRHPGSPGVDPAAAPASPTWNGDGNRDEARGGGAAPDRVAFEGLPAGYAEVGESFSPMPVQGGPVSHVMVSDGVASVSVYVEHVAAEHQDRSVAGLSSIGGISAYGRSLPDGFVTVVGEVPAATVRRVADAVVLR